MKEIVRYGLILGIICFTASAVLAVVNGVTAPRIEAQKEKEEAGALKEVMPEAATFEPREVKGKKAYYAACNKSGKIIGFVIKAEAKGYSSNIESITGLDRKLQITEVRVLSQNETPGLGNRICAGPFLAQFKGKGEDNLNQVQAITGATISSSALINSVKDRILELKPELLKELR